LGRLPGFLIQFFARIKEGFLITKLELLALSFAILNFGTYFMWWNKPQRVRYPIKFDISESARSTNSEDGYPDGFCTRQSLSQELHKIGRGESGSYEEVPLQGNVKNKLSDNSSLPSNIWRCMVATASSTHYESGHEDRDLKLAQWSMIFSFMALSAYIPFFVDLFVLADTASEQPLWRSCIFGVSFSPMIFYFLVSFWRSIRKITPGVIPRTISRAMVIIFFVLYATARLTLVVLAFIELLRFQSSCSASDYYVFRTVQWTTFIPHI